MNPLIPYIVNNFVNKVVYNCVSNFKGVHLHYEKITYNTFRNGCSLRLPLYTTSVYYAFRTFFRIKIMTNYKITNRISGVSETLNYEQVQDRIEKSKGSFFFIYSYKIVSSTPIQDYMNEDRLSILDVMFIALCTFALSIATFLLINSII